ncbi:MAG: ABC transporter substrate-binding protein [Syntrophobacteraceae bacterium]
MRCSVSGVGRRPTAGFGYNFGFMILFFCFLAGCGDTRQAESEKKEAASVVGGVYRIPLLNNPKNFDPIRAEDQYSTAVVYQLFDGLVRFSPDLLVIPALAESWRIGESGTVYRFLLREKAYFHNGKPITSGDVLFSLARLIKADPAPTILPYMLKIQGADEYRSGQADDLPGVRVINEREIEIRLKEPSAPFLAALGMHQTRIVPRDEVVSRGERFGENPVGSGPFAFVSWESNRSVRLKRFPEYYSGSAFLDEIEYVIYPGGKFEEVFGDFRKHRLHEMPAYDGKIRNRLLAIQGIKLVQRPSVSLQFYGMNCRDPVLSQPALRRALSLAIDRRRLSSEVYGGRFELARSLIPPGILGYNPEKHTIEEDFSKAKEELRSLFPADFSHGLSLEIVSSIQSPVAIAEFEYIAECWKELGITLRPKFIPNWAEFEQYIQSPEMQIYRYVWYMDIPDPDNILRVLFGSNSNVNYIRYENEEADRALLAGQLMLNPVERAKIYQGIETLITREMPIIPLVHLNIDQAYQSDVNGIELNALGRHKSSLYQVWLSPGTNK